MDDTQKIIQEQFKKLPKSLQDAILAIDLHDKIKMISEKHKLLIDKAAIFENETMLIMLGLENHTDYTNNIRKELEITDEQAQEITKDVNEQIFLPIRESLKEIENKNIEEAQKESEQDAVQEIAQETQDQAPQETPESHTQEPSNIFENKLTQQVRSPKENVRMEESSTKKEKTMPQSIDPYREPVED